MDRVDQALRARGAREQRELRRAVSSTSTAFKLVNDSLSHGFGDRLLIALAPPVWPASCAPVDTVARIGGDEFTLLLEGGVDSEGATAVAERLRNSLTRFVQRRREGAVS